MAVSFGASNGKEYWDLRGLSSDEKPVNGVPNGSKFEEIDTGNEFKLDGGTGTWYLQPTASGGGGGGVAGVSTFNNRSGAVMPLAGDYTADMVGADPAGSAAAALTGANTYTDNALAGFTVSPEFIQAVDTAVEEAVEQAVSGATSGDIDALFP